MPSSQVAPKRSAQHKSVNVSDISSADSIPSPVTSPVNADLERKTKECETAKKLVELMRQHRQTDLATIAELTQKIIELESEMTRKADEAHSELNVTRDAFEAQLEKSKLVADSLAADLVAAGESTKVAIRSCESKEAELVSLAIELGIVKKAIEAKEAERAATSAELVAARRNQVSLGDELVSARQAVEAKESELAKVRQLMEAAKAEVVAKDRQNEALQAELRSVQDTTQAELIAARQSNAALSAQVNTLSGELRVKEVELESAGSSLDQKSRDLELLTSKQSADARIKTDEIRALGTQVAALIEQNRTLAAAAEKEKAVEKAATTKMEQIIAELTSAKLSAERRARTAENKQTQLADEINSLKQSLAKEDHVERDLREEIENLLLQQTQAIESVSVANTQAAASGKLLADATSNLKNTTHKLSAVEKALASKEALIAQLTKNEGECKSAFANRVAQITKQYKHNAVITAVVSCVATLIISQIMFLISHSK